MACNAIGGFPSQQLSLVRKERHGGKNAWILETIIVYFIII